MRAPKAETFSAVNSSEGQSGLPLRAIASGSFARPVGLLWLEERKQTLFEAQRIVQDEVPYVFLYTPISRFALQPWLKGFMPMASSETYYHNYMNVWKDK